MRRRTSIVATRSGSSCRLVKVAALNLTALICILSSILVVIISESYCVSAAKTEIMWTQTTNCIQMNNNNKKVQVYILAGQSNMVGMGSIDHLDQLISNNGSSSDPNNNNNEYRDSLWDETTNAYREREDVYIVYNSNHGKLTVSRSAGYAGTNAFGPEVMFGWTIAASAAASSTDDCHSDNHNNNTIKTSDPKRMILLIKVAYGGRDLAIDFRSPSAGMGNYTNVNDPTHYGWEYRIMMNDIVAALQSIPNYIPNYQEIYTDGHELCGFIWFQGWNDMLSWPKVNEYESNLAHFIHDVRIDLNHTNLPFVIGELGMHGMTPTGKESGRVYAMRSAQQNVCTYTDNTIFVPTAQFAVLNGTTYNGIYHYNGRADTYFHIGQALGNSMRKLLVQTNTEMNSSPSSAWTSSASISSE